MGRKGDKKTASAPQAAEPRGGGKFDKVLGLIVFLSGASLMALELVGSRIIAPTYGSSIFTWGSLIGIFMLALSIGYFFGGKLADAFPSFMTLAVILALAGIGVMVIPFAALPVCEAFAPMQQKWGSLFTSLTLFGPPSILMGMVSPLAIRLEARKPEKMGGVAGSLYALSTVGSIVGTFATAFYLITLVGMYALTKGIGALLLATALIALVKALKAGAARKAAAALALVVVGSAAPALAVPSPLPIETEGIGIVATQDSPYNTLFVIDYPYAGERRLQFNNRCESGFYLDRPWESSFNYTAAMHAALGANREVKRVLLIGGGGAVLPVEFICAYGDMDFDSVEIDPGVIEFSRKYFVDYAVKWFERKAAEGDATAATKAERLRRHIHLIDADGRLFVRRPECKGRYDLILMDAYLGGRIPFHLTTREFFADLATCLAEGGVMAMNIISAYRGPNGRIFRSIYRTVGEFFPHVVIVPPSASYFALGVPPLLADRHPARNIVLVATRDKPLTGATLRGSLKRLLSTGFFPEHIAGRIWSFLPDIGTVEEYERQEQVRLKEYARRADIPLPRWRPIIDPERDIILTDDFCPVDVWSGFIMLE